METPEKFCLRWNSYKSNLQTAFPKLLTSEHFVDVTLACEKQFIKCHKIVLSACSAYFEKLLVNNPCPHPIIFMKDVEFWEIQALVEFMYKGEVSITQNQLDSLLKSAESLEIRGLSGSQQFVNLDQSGDTEGESLSDNKNKKNKSGNEDNEDVCTKRRRRLEGEDKCIQISTAEAGDDSNKQQYIIDNTYQIVRSEGIVLQDFNYGNPYISSAVQDKPETSGYSQDLFYSNQNNDPGPSGLSEKEEVEVSRRRDEDGKGSPSSTSTTVQLSKRHSIDVIPRQRNGRRSKMYRFCVVCFAKGVDGRKVWKKTRYYCPDCDVGLCVQCFGVYHMESRRSLRNGKEVGKGHSVTELPSTVDWGQIGQVSKPGKDIVHKEKSEREGPSTVDWEQIGQISKPDEKVVVDDGKSEKKRPLTVYWEQVGRSLRPEQEIDKEKSEEEESVTVCGERVDQDSKSEKEKERSETQKKKPIKRCLYKQYSLDSMWAALEKIEQGQSVYRASIEFGIPKKTLRNWMEKYNIVNFFEFMKKRKDKTKIQKTTKPVRPTRLSKH